MMDNQMRKDDMRTNLHMVHSERRELMNPSHNHVVQKNGDLPEEPNMGHGIYEEVEISTSSGGKGKELPNQNGQNQRNTHIQMPCMICQKSLISENPQPGGKSTPMEHKYSECECLISLTPSMEMQSQSQTGDQAGAQELLGGHQSNPNPKPIAAYALHSNDLTSEWKEAAAAPIIPVRCKKMNAELHKEKFGSGKKGRCISVSNQFLTPEEFETFCGRVNHKDWKRSIRVGGQTLRVLVNLGYLKPHSHFCKCMTCSGNPAAVADPIFAPSYSRKRKPSAVTKDNLGPTNYSLTSSDLSLDLEPSKVPHLSPSTTDQQQQPVKIKMPATVPFPSTSDEWTFLEKGLDEVVETALTLRSCVQQMRERSDREMHELKSKLDVQNSLIQTVVQMASNQQAQVGIASTSAGFGISPGPSNWSNPATVDNACQNCGRPGSLQCSVCLSVYYCSLFCQRKDWEMWHGKVCRTPNTELTHNVGTV